MSTLTFQSNVGYNSIGKAYQGDGVQVNRRRLADTLAARLKLPTIKVSILVTVTAGMWLKGAVVHSGRVMKFTVPTFVTEVLMNGGEITLTKTISLATCVATVATFFYDSATKVLYVNPPNPTSRSFFDDTYQARLIFYFSKHPKKLRGVFWDPRLVSAPDISLRIEPKFSGVGQIGGGKLTLNNGDGYFDQLDENVQWDAGRVIMEIGADMPDGQGDMAESDYQKVGTWRTERTGREGLNFALNLREPKTNLENKIPHREYTRSEFPNIAEDLLGKPIPMAWGTLFSKAPILIDKAAKKFKIADHPIWGIEAIRIKTTTEGWKTINYATVDNNRAEFTLGGDWTDEEVAVDFKGRKNPDGSLMENPADIAADVLNYVGESKMDATSFFLAREWFVIGKDRFGQEVTELAPCIHLDTHRTGLEVMSQINNICGTFLFVDHEGFWRFSPFVPVRGQDLDPLAGNPMQTFTDREILEGSMSKTVDSAKLFSKVVVRYAERTVEGWAPTVSDEVKRNQFIHDLPPQFTETKTVGLGKSDDADYWLERFLNGEARPLTRYTFTVPWPGLFILPGDKARVNHTLRGINAVLEVYEAHYNFNSPPTVRLVAGNLRGWGDTFCFLADDGADGGIPQAGLHLWLAATDLALPQSAGVQQWLDRSGKQNHATQSVAAKRPIYSGFSGPNDDPAVSLASGQYLDLPAFAAGFQAGELFIVLRAPDPATSGLSNCPYSFGATGDDTAYPNTAGTIGEAFGVSTAVNIADPASSLSDQFHVYNVSVTSANITARLDNVSLASVAHSDFRFASPHYLGRGVTSSVYFGGEICEIIVYDRVLSAAERAQVVQYLSDKFLFGIVALGTSPDWNPAWTDTQVANARQNRGYYTGQDGNLKETDMADATDARSYWPGRIM